MLSTIATLFHTFMIKFAPHFYDFLSTFTICSTLLNFHNTFKIC